MAILVSSPTKAATLMQFRDTIEKMFGEATFECQETCKTFVIDPIPKTIRGLDGIYPEKFKYKAFLGSTRFISGFSSTND